MKLTALLGKLQSLRPQSPGEASNSPAGTRPPGSNRSNAASLRAAIAMQAPRDASGSRPATARFSAAAPPVEASSIGQPGPGVRKQIRRQYAALRDLGRRCRFLLSTRADLQAGKTEVRRSGSTRVSRTAQVAIPLPTVSERIVRGDSPKATLHAARPFAATVSRTAQVAAPSPAASQRVAEGDSPKAKFDAALHAAAVAWEARIRPGRSAEHAQGPLEASFRPPANDFERYKRRWDRATTKYDAAVAQARQAYEAALAPTRAAAVPNAHGGQEAVPAQPAIVSNSKASQEPRTVKEEASLTLQNAIAWQRTTVAEVAATTTALAARIEEAKLDLDLATGDAAEARKAYRETREEVVRNANEAQAANMAAQKAVRLARDNLLKIEAQENGSR